MKNVYFIVCHVTKAVLLSQPIYRKLCYSFFSFLWSTLWIPCLGKKIFSMVAAGFRSYPFVTENTLKGREHYEKSTSMLWEVAYCVRTQVGTKNKFYTFPILHKTARFEIILNSWAKFQLLYCTRTREKIGHCIIT